MAEMSTSDINDLPDSDFAYIEPGGTKDSGGKTVPRDKRHFPIHDAAHVRNALARAPQSPFGEKAMPKIKAAAEKFGIDVADDSSSSRSAAYTRSFALDDISVRSGGDGRTVEAYAAIFNTAAPVRDQDGDYEEIIDPTCFNRAIERSTRSKRPIPVLFNHGMTLFHTPSERDSAPIGVAEEVRADQRGLFTRARFHKTSRADEILEAIRDGSITSYSFSGAFHRSDPHTPRGGYRKNRDGSLPTVRRMESTLREFGPATFPVYSGAEIVGVRAENAALMLATLPASERQRLAELLGGTVGDNPALAPGAFPEHGDAARSNHNKIAVATARFRLRSR